MKTNLPTFTATLTPLERSRKIPVREAAEMNSLHESTFRRHYKHLIRDLSARRQGVTLGDAIDLPPPKPTA